MPYCLRQLFDGPQISGGHLLIHGDGRGTGELMAHTDIEVAATDAFADNLPDARLQWLEALGHAKMQVEKPMIHAAHGDTQADAVVGGLRLGVAGH